jgi:lipopolysaccharide biosynthesis glycosyltransferase
VAAVRVFIGVDPRDAISFNVLQWSIIRRTSQPVVICPLVLPQLRFKRKGLTEFTFTRYLVPELCGFKGKALFLDSDMLCLGDISELFAIEFPEPVAVVKNEQRFEWPSLMMFNNALCTNLTRNWVEDEQTKPYAFEWARGVGELPSEWNHCVGYDEPREDAKLVHYTAGTPGFKERRACEYSWEWHEELKSMNSQTSWLEIHGNSVHRDKVLAEIWPGSQQKPH